MHILKNLPFRVQAVMVAELFMTQAAAALRSIFRLGARCQFITFLLNTSTLLIVVIPKNKISRSVNLHFTYVRFIKYFMQIIVINIYTQVHGRWQKEKKREE